MLHASKPWLTGYVAREHAVAYARAVPRRSSAHATVHVERAKELRSTRTEKKQWVERRTIKTTIVFPPGLGKKDNNSDETIKVGLERRNEDDKKKQSSRSQGLRKKANVTSKLDESKGSHP